MKSAPHSPFELETLFTVCPEKKTTVFVRKPDPRPRWMAAKISQVQVFIKSELVLVFINAVL